MPAERVVSLLLSCGCVLAASDRDLPVLLAVDEHTCAEHGRVRLLALLNGPPAASTKP